MGPDAVAIVVGARLAMRSADTEFPFRQDSDFWYLTGFDHPDAVAIFSTREGPSFSLFVQARDRAAETWTGIRPGIEGAVAEYGADVAYPYQEFLSKLPEILRGAKRIYHCLGRNPEIDSSIITLQDEIRRQSRGGVLPADEMIDPRLLIHEMRLHKSADEIRIMQRAADITLEAHRRAARLAQPKRFEYELEAELEHVFRSRGGSGPAYGTIVGGGVNATILHYIRNDKPLRAGDLVLIDAGVELEGYASDVTRTYPVGGRFEPAARDLYEVVLAAQEKAIDVSAPGKTLPEIHSAALKVLCEGMVSLDILQGDVDQLIESEAFRPYYMHGTSHWLGLDVHDVGAYVSAAGTAEGHSQTSAKPRPLCEGMVYTIEPGLYIPIDDPKVPEAFRGIGIRIEDDIVVTKDGVLNLNREIPKAVDEIEAWVRGD
jgi:Xaa-Pro aminopeptidase